MGTSQHHAGPGRTQPREQWWHRRAPPGDTHAWGREPLEGIVWGHSCMGTGATGGHGSGHAQPPRAAGRTVAVPPRAPSGGAARGQGRAGPRRARCGSGILAAPGSGGRGHSRRSGVRVSAALSPAGRPGPHLAVPTRGGAARGGAGGAGTPGEARGRRGAEPAGGGAARAARRAPAAASTWVARPWLRPAAPTRRGSGPTGEALTPPAGTTTPARPHPGMGFSKSRGTRAPHPAKQPTAHSHCTQLYSK